MYELRSCGQDGRPSSSECPSSPGEGSASDEPDVSEPQERRANHYYSAPVLSRWRTAIHPGRIGSQNVANR